MGGNWWTEKLATCLLRDLSVPISAHGGDARRDNARVLRDRLVPVHVLVPSARRDRELVLVGVPVVLLMGVPVIVGNGIMGVLVLVLVEVQPDANCPQNRRHHDWRGSDSPRTRHGLTLSSNIFASGVPAPNRTAETRAASTPTLRGLVSFMRPPRDRPYLHS